MIVKEKSEKVVLKLNIHKTKIMASGPITSWQIDGETMETVRDFIFFFFLAPKSLQMVTATMKLKDIYSLEENYYQPRQHIKKQRYYFASESPSSQSYGFSGGHVWMWELGYKESWAPENWCFWIVVLENTLESPLDSKEIQLVHPKGNQSWIFIGRTDAEAETPICWWYIPNVSNSSEKTLMLGKIEGSRRRGQQKMKLLNNTINSMGMSLSKLQELAMDREAWGAAVHGVAKNRTRLSNWTELNWVTSYILCDQAKQKCPLFIFLCQCFFHY